MKVFKICFSKGGLGKSEGCELAPNRLIDNCIEVNVNNGNVVETHENIFNSLKGKEGSIVLGGDHSISYSCFKAALEGNPGMGLIVFDAHPDCVNNFSPPSHEDYLRVLIEESYLDPKKLVVVGLRDISNVEYEFLRDYNVVYFDMDKIFDLGVEEICDMIMERALSWDSVYLSLDIDVVDPAFAPGTGNAVPGGLSSREILYFMKRLKNMKNLRCVDIVELNPVKDVNDMTVKLGKQILKVFK